MKRKLPYLKAKQNLNSTIPGQGSNYSGGGGGGKLSPKRFSFPSKSFSEKNLKLLQIKIFFDEDFKESVKVTNVQKCDFSQS